MMSFVLEPFSYDFFPRAVLAACFVMLLGALAGVSVRAQGQVYLGQGMSQSLLAGVAAAALTGVSGFVASFAAALLAAVLVSFLTRFAKTGIDTAIAIVSSVLMASGIAFLSMFRSNAVNVTNILFGNVLGVSWSDVLVIGVVMVVSGLFFVVYARKLALTALDASVAAAQGVNTKVLNITQIIVVSLAIASFVQVAGTLLSVVALVIPVATAQLMSRSLAYHHIFAVLFGILSAFLGLLLSFWTDIPSGPAITITASLFFVMVLFSTRIFVKR